jgi:prepilin-type N-terminal cleavage/methylation domain-containing protein
MISYIHSIQNRGFTLIETLVAVTLLVVAIVAPMSLVSQSLTSAFYARDQVAAYSLAQEGIEAVRAVRDGNILNNAINGASEDLLANIIPPGSAERTFTIDARESGVDGIETCGATCPYLQVDPSGQLYGYGSGWTLTKFRRTVHAKYVPPLVNNRSDEIRVTVTILWDTASGRVREFKMYSNMYRWVEDGAAS